MKRSAILAFAAFNLLVIMLVTGLRWYDPAPLRELRYAAFDQYQRILPRDYQPMPVRIVDIDERSLRVLGQWPWPRSLLVKLLQRLKDLGAATVAFDVLFAEQDRLSPRAVMASVPGVDASFVAGLPDNDDLFAAQVAQQPVVLGFAASQAARNPLPAAKAGFALVGQNPIDAVQHVAGAVVPLPALAAAAQGLGDVSMNSEQENAVVRAMPMFLGDSTHIVPSLAMEALRVAQGATSYIVKSTTDGAPAIIAAKVGDMELPMTRTGNLWLYLTPERPERYVSASDILNGKDSDLAPLIQGNIVFVGTSAAGLLDIRATPLGQNVPGVSLHAQAVEQILAGKFLSRPDWVDGLEVAAVALLGLLVALIMGLLPPAIAPVVALAIPAAFIGASWYAFRSAGFLLDPVAPVLGALAVEFAALGYRLLVADRDRRHIRRALGNYVSPAILHRAEQQRGQLRLGGDDREISMMFMDIRGFTTISESMAPTALVTILNRLLTGLSKHVLDTEGTLDKFIGDSIMAFWNAPVDIREHAKHAAVCALRMRESLRAMNSSGTLGFDHPVEIGIGINTGIACVGEIGAENRFNYSAIGDAVNTAARIEGMCKEIGFDLLVSGSTAEQLKGFALLPAGTHRLRGQSNATELFLLVGDETAAAQDAFATLARIHAEFSEARARGSAQELSRCVSEAVRASGAFLPELQRYYARHLERLSDDAFSIEVPA